MKKLFSLMITVVIICNMALPAFAEAAATPNPQPNSETPAATDNGKPGTGTGAADPAAGTTTPPAGTNTPADPAANPSTPQATVESVPNISSDAYVVMNLETGQVLVTKNPHKQEYPSDITKILTTALALDSGLDVNAKHVVQREDVFQPPDYTQNYEASGYIPVDVGEEVTLEAMLYATMIKSANDAAVILANSAAQAAGTGVTKDDGTTDYTTGFINMMNEKAKAIGAVNTNFTSVHGLYNENQYTTAYDMALITRYAFNVSTFQKYFSATEYTMQPTNKQPSSRTWKRANEGMMNPASENYFQGTDGVSLGISAKSNNTGVSVATKNGITLICVALNCTGSNSYAIQHDMTSLFNYCFDNFNPVTYTQEDLYPEKMKTAVYDKRGVDGTDIGYATLTADKDFTILLHKKYNKNDVLLSSDIPGHYFEDEMMNSTITFTLKQGEESDGQSYMVPQIASLKMKVNVFTYEEMKLEKENQRKELINKILNIVKYVCFGIVGLAVLLVVIRIINYQRYKKRKQRRRNAQARRKKVHK